MSNDIEKYSAPLKDINGRKAKSTDEEITMALAPLFVQYPNMDASDAWLKQQCLIYRNIPADKLARAVVQAIANDTTGFPPAPGVIRGYAEDAERIPGPRSEIDWNKRKPVPQNMYHLDPEEDKRQRMARLARTKGWKYA